ncbi:hypothetical protein Egran_04215 [Elaphomyces granulatus]|uniref:non-specific serine/threonine protein kinase n=1 Tax=Elaphomyces granulatus TaxID=519963 RepID=A0A232LV70_9EURO|nr:hypothetical protein Egran_04215 [Elaphomyces granulatus]
MRWLRSSGGIPPALLLFLSGLAALQQRTWAGSAQAADGDLPPQVDVLSEPRGPRQNPHYESVKDANDASALATMALAGSGRAVRAPPAQASPSAGLVPQLQARSLRDWEVEDFVLLATVDGTIHARDRRTGAARWALEVPGSPMVESIYHRAGPSSLRRQDSSSPSTAFSSSSSSSFSFSFSSSPSSAATAAISSSSSGSAAEASSDNDFLWIVEPSRDGSLYIYAPGTHGGLQKLGLTVKELVDQTPYSGEHGVTYTARKETTLYTVDARTGEILRVFSSRGPITPQQGCRKVDNGDPDGQECESTGTLTVGRIEYAVAIQNTETGAPICTLKYSEWAANSRDQDLQSQYYRTMDQSHIYSMHDGVVLGFDHSRMERPRFTQRFSAPVIRVFDVARPIDRQSPEKVTPLVLLAQPRDPPDPDYGSSERDERVFIDCTAAGGWYAMSESTYPLVTGRAKTALCYEKDFFRDGRSLLSLDLAHQREALAGVHAISESARGNGQTQSRPIPRLVDPSPPESSNDTPLNVPRLPSDFPSSPVPYNSVIIRKGWDNALDIFVTLVLLFIGTFIYLNSHHLQHLLRQKLDLQNIIAAYGGPGSLPAPSTPVVSDPPGKGIARSFPETESAEQGQGQFQTPPQKAATVSFARSTETPDDPDREGGDVTPRARSTPRLTSETTPIPTVRIREPSQLRESGEENGEELNPHEPEKKKRARRGRRGGVAHKRKPRSDSEGARENRPSAEEKDVVPPVSSLVTPLGREFSLVRTASSDVLELDGAVRIGRLAVYIDTVLGHGSHGTVVYKGSFDGRDVAVKRMLVEFYDIASHEVGLLQESDDHSNVIRYFCREQAAGFLYIALELCPASLQDVVERPHDYPQLVHGGLDVPDILRQITAGVRHLHSLKIVHRDLKPQNILVATPRGRSGHPALRLLISDFGLCKKLEDNQSSFRATTAHAAGTSGWRAPELLVDDQNPNPVLMTESQNTESSEPAVVDPQTNRRATRAIDIFSLGCVFYYVLTRGGHPYDKDGKFMREANIVKGNYNLTDLERLGDYAFEADDLIKQMLSLNPRRRPDATTVLIHPFFWSAADRLSFLCDVSDHFEFEPRDPPSSALLHLESVARDVMGPDQDFLKHLPKEFKDSLGKQRKYTGSRMLDLLRALRNKRNHYNDMSEHLKAHIGGLPDGYLRFWAVRFPSLLTNCHRVVTELNICQVERFKRYFTPPDQ